MVFRADATTEFLLELRGCFVVLATALVAVRGEALIGIFNAELVILR
jgi:hypothetical protein